MRGSLILLLMVLSISCSTKAQKSVEVTQNEPKIVYVNSPEDAERIKTLEAEVKFWRDSVQTINSTIPFNVYMNARRIEKIKYYISICERNTNNKKFFYGWIKRTMSD